MQETATNLENSFKQIKIMCLIPQICYNDSMKAKTLIETNPYLKDAVKRQKYTEVSVRSSCGVEGIKASKGEMNIVIQERSTPLFDKFKSKLASWK